MPESGLSRWELEERALMHRQVKALERIAVALETGNAVAAIAARGDADVTHEGVRALNRVVHAGLPELAPGSKG